MQEENRGRINNSEFCYNNTLHSLQLVGCGWKRMEERREIEDLRKDLRDRTQEVKK